MAHSGFYRVAYVKLFKTGLVCEQVAILKVEKNPDNSRVGIKTQEDG